MEWSKLKNIIILILLIANGFMIALLGVRESQSIQYQEELEAQIRLLLEQNGIVFLPEQMPEDMALPTLELTRSREGEASMAAALLGKLTGENETGGVWAHYTGEGGEAEFFSSGRFTFTFADGVHLLGTETWEDYTSNCMRQLGLEGVYSRTEGEDREGMFYCYQVWEDSPVFNCEIAFVYQGGQLIKMDGTYLAGMAQRVEQETPLTTATVLVQFLAGVNDGAVSVCTQIQSMTAGYVTSSVRPVVMTPVWYITTDTGSYYVNASTGGIASAVG